MEKYVNGRQLKFLVHSAGYTDKEFGELIGSTQGYVKKIFSSVYKLNSKVCMRFKEALNCSDEELLSDTYKREAAIIGSNLRKARQLAGTTQTALSRKLNINVCVYNNYEHGKYVPDYKLLRNICKQLNVNICDIYKSEDIASNDNLSLDTYLQVRLQILSKRLTTAKSMTDKLELQGRLDELNRLISELNVQVKKCS